MGWKDGKIGEAVKMQVANKNWCDFSGYPHLLHKLFQILGGQQDEWTFEASDTVLILGKCTKAGVWFIFDKLWALTRFLLEGLLGALEFTIPGMGFVVHITKFFVQLWKKGNVSKNKMLTTVSDWRS